MLIYCIYIHKEYYHYVSNFYSKTGMIMAQMMYSSVDVVT